MSIFIPLDRLDALARKFCIGPYAKKQHVPVRENPAVGPNEFFIEELKDLYVFENLLYNGVKQSVSWSKRLLDKGEERTQDEWFEFLQGSEWQLPDAPLYHATLASLCQCKDGPQSDLVKKVRRMFAKNFRNNYLITGTHVVYKSRGKDSVKHNSSGVIKQATIVGADGNIHSQNGFEDSIEALLGTRDLTQVENVYKWISGKKPYLVRLNNRPNLRTERAVVLGVYKDSRFGIYCVDYVDNSWPALGVVYTGAKNFCEK